MSRLSASPKRAVRSHRINLMIGHSQWCRIERVEQERVEQELLLGGLNLSRLAMIWTAVVWKAPVSISSIEFWTGWPIHTRKMMHDGPIGSTVHQVSAKRH